VDKVQPLFPDRAHAAEETEVDEVVADLRRLADEIERGEIVVKAGVICSFEDHKTHIRTRTAGAMTKHHCVTILTLSQAMIVADLVHPD
jgi:hypothetical protein